VERLGIKIKGQNDSRPFGRRAYLYDISLLPGMRTISIEPAFAGSSGFAPAFADQAGLPLLLQGQAGLPLLLQGQAGLRISHNRAVRFADLRPTQSGTRERLKGRKMQTKPNARSLETVRTALLQAKANRIAAGSKKREKRKGMGSFDTVRRAVVKVASQWNQADMRDKNLHFDKSGTPFLVSALARLT